MGDFHFQVIMIAHQTVSMEDNLPLLVRMAELRQEDLSVFIGQKNIVSGDPSRRDGT